MNSPTLILAGDIGGTKTELALFDAARTDPSGLLKEERFVSRDFDSLESLVEKFLDGHTDRLAAACFGVAGPVIEDTARTTNLPWLIDEEGLRRRFGVGQVHLINDLEATGHGILGLSDDQLVVLNKGDAVEHGNRAVIAAGTGLGEAAFVWTGQRYEVLASEGGHADFAPRNELEIELLRFLLTKHKRVSYERVLSGPGLVNVYNFLRSREVTGPDSLDEELANSQDQAKTISTAGMEKKSELAVKALDIFAAVYGAQAGNLVLTFSATGGIYLAGGIAPKIASKLTDGTFLRAFKDKGRLSPMVAASPVFIVMNPRTALMGAARYAAERLGQ
jgi:glucokinase